MSRSTGLLALAILALVLTVPGAALGADQPIPLALKFAAGDTLQYDVTFAGSGGVTVPGAEIAAVGVQGSLTILQKVVEALPDGSGRLETTIPRIQADVTIGSDKASFTFADGKVRWFANGKESAPPDDAALKDLPVLMSPVVITMAPNGRTTGFAFSDPQLMSQLAQMIPPGLDLTQAMGQNAAVFPDKPMAVGETWRDTRQRSPLGPQMPVTVSVSRTLDSYTEQGGVGVAKISGFTDARMRGMGDLAAPGGFAISIPQLRQTITSTEFFNVTKGQLVRGDYDIGFRMDFGVKLGEEQKTGNLEARFRVSVQAR